MSAATSPFADQSAHGSAGGNDHAQGPPRKKMRKGTKSCIECRRRKIKCTFEPGRTAVCNECFARGSTCVDQEHGDLASFASTTASTETSSLKDRVSNLEDLLKQVLHRLPERDGTDDDQLPDLGSHPTQVDAQAAEVLKSLRSPPRSSKANIDESAYFGATPRDSVPVLSLFDNAVIETKEVVPTMTREQYNKAKSLIAAILQMLPPIDDLEIILESSQEWWAIWKSLFPDITDRRCATIKEAVSHTLRSEKPAEVGKIMLCIALSIQQLPHDFDWDRLSIKESPEDLLERYMSTIDRLIISDEEIAATVDGIECMTLTAKFHINMGRPRKSWLLYRRAISFAELLGIHRLPQRKPAEPSRHYLRQIMIWTHLLFGDRYLSCVLGLPYAVNERFCQQAFDAARSFPEGANATERYLCDVLPIITKMIDRNQNPSGTPYSVTMAMEHELEEVRSKTDASWWTTDRLPATTVEEHFERLQAQFAHHYVRVMLHMPFMLKSSADKRYQYSHAATLESSREVIKHYDALRGSENIGPHACKMIDFQAFSSAMLLVLNLSGYSQQARGAVPQQPDLDQDQQDSNLIDRAIHLLKGAADDTGGTVAANSAAALELLAGVRNGMTEDTKHQDSCQVSIPYFGTITIRKGKQFVPIKPGTYPEAGKSLPLPLPSQTGLPTPPSMCSGTSAQPSPRESLVSAPNRDSPYWNNHEMRARGVDVPWTGVTEDPYITFDSFMAFPSAAQIDFSSLASTDLSTNGTDLSQQPAFGGLGTMEEQHIAAGYPFPLMNSGNVDLDGGWNWFGVGAPSMGT